MSRWIDRAEETAASVDEGFSGFAAYDFEIGVCLQVFLCMAKRKDRAHGVKKRISIFFLSLHSRRVFCAVDRQIQIFTAACGEAQVCAVVPLHGCSGTGAEITALLGGNIEILHADFITVIEERYSGQGEQEGIRELELGRIQVVAGTDRVVVAGQNRDVAEILRVLIPCKILVQEAVDVAARIFLEIAVVLRVPVTVDTAAVVVVVAHQCGVASAHLIEDEVHIIAGAKGKGRIAPFRHHGRIGKFQVQHAAHVSPDRAGTAFFLIVVLDQRRSHIYAEAIAAVGQPEAHNVFERLAGRDRGRVAHALLPGFRHIQEAVIESRLALEEVEDIAAASLALAADIGKVLGAVEAELCPDKAVGILVLFDLLALAEPGVFLGCVAGDKIQKDTDALFVRLVKEVVEILVGTVAGRHFLVIADIVTRVFKRRIITGIDPERIAAQALDIIELFGDARDISDAVPVRIIKGLGIDLIEYCVF